MGLEEYTRVWKETVAPLTHIKKAEDLPGDHVYDYEDDFLRYSFWLTSHVEAFVEIKRTSDLDTTVRSYIELQKKHNALEELGYGLGKFYSEEGQIEYTLPTPQTPEEIRKIIKDFTGLERSL